MRSISLFSPTYPRARNATGVPCGDVPVRCRCRRLVGAPGVHRRPDVAVRHRVPRETPLLRSLAHRGETARPRPRVRSTGEQACATRGTNGERDGGSINRWFRAISRTGTATPQASLINSNTPSQPRLNVSPVTSVRPAGTPSRPRTAVARLMPAQTPVRRPDTTSSSTARTIHTGLPFRLRLGRCRTLGW